MIRQKVAVLSFGTVIALATVLVVVNDDDGPGNDEFEVAQGGGVDLTPPAAQLRDAAIDVSVTGDGHALIDSSTGVVNEAFSFLPSSELGRIAPSIDQKFFSGESDGSYLGHIVVRVDTESFKNQLQVAWLEAENSDSDVFVTVPIKENVMAKITVSSWIKHASGVVAGYGDSLVDGERIRESAQVYFSPDGNMRLSLSSSDANYNFSFVRDFSTYVVMETSPILRID